MAEKNVVIFGGGVAALAAATALVESNEIRNDVTFRVHLATRDDIWGGRASSWTGGIARRRALDHEGHHQLDWDFSYWPPTVPLNHGFHAVFDRSTYANFWHMLDLVWNSPARPPHALEGDSLISNEHQVVVYENDRVCDLNIHPSNKYPIWPFNSYLTDAAFKLWWSGGWSIWDILSFRKVIAKKVFSYQDFDRLADLDMYQRIAFKKWCRDKCMREGVFNKGMFKFIFDGTYVAPNDMDATSGLMALWVLMRHYDATQWFYINGGITPLLMDPVVEYLAANHVEHTKWAELHRFVMEGNRLVGYELRDPREPKPDLKRAPKPAFTPDYYISTLPLDNMYRVLHDSDMLGHFRKIQTLREEKHFVQPVGTVNLQAWFQDKHLVGHYRNVIGAFEPLCVMIDYKNILPFYKNDDRRFPGSVLEINGALQELCDPNSSGYWECDRRFRAPDQDDTIDFAKEIIRDIAKRYDFPQLHTAVEKEQFLVWPDEWKGRRHWKGNKIPPFLWQNTDPYNRFFVTGPGTLENRPWIWENTHPTNLFLAGDWTRNGFDVPSMEGAARSGRMAALAVLKSALGMNPEADPRKPEPTKGDRSFIQIYDPRAR